MKFIEKGKVDMHKKKNKSRIPFRANMLFFAVFILFTVLVIQLGIVQILEGESHQAEIDRTINDVSKSSVPRGKIFDRNGEIIVDNNPLYAITYTPPKRVQADEKLELAEKLIEYIEMEDKVKDKISERNKKEYWYLKNQKKATDRLTDKEIEDLDDVEQYDLALERITDDDLDEITDEEMDVIAIKRELDKAYALTPEVIKNKDISIKEYAKIAEHLNSLPGIDATTDWERKYVHDDTFKSILGSITSQEEGIPADKEDYFLARGYNRNDRIGKSGLEEQYEDMLRGRKEQIEYTMTKNGKVLGTDVKVPGSRGKDLILTIDMDYQKKVDDLVLKELKNARSKGNTYAEDALAIALNPKTGEILAMSGQHYDKEKDKYENISNKVIHDQHIPGSTVKGATVLTGLETGLMSPGETIQDSPIKIAGTPIKRSYTTGLGSVDDKSALKKSSNIYMFYVALRAGGDNRYPFPNNSSTNMSNSEGILTMRNYFNQFGLGVKTGIDFPYEGTGVEGTNPAAGNVLDFAIGQYDTYTTLQLGQYVSTIANDGYRVRPHLVKEIRSPSLNNDELGPVEEVLDTKVLNKLNIKDEYIKRTQDGFWKAFNEPGGTGHRHWANKSYKAAGKTGTAQNAIYDTREDGTPYEKAKTENLSLVGYAPYDDPEIAFAVIVPNLSSSKGDSVNHKIGTGMLDLYFDKKKEDNDED